MKATLRLVHTRRGSRLRIPAASSLVLLFLLRFAGPPAVSAGPATPDATELSLEDLMTREVTSASKKSQSIAEVAAAVFVITQEDIRRAGAMSIPEALRLAPGVHVARIDSNKWAVGIRGFNGGYSDKLLVLIDGRSVYSPAFGGVFWDVQDTLMEDVERIEIVRGPGAALWGANAVNGVINVITRSAQQSHGGLALLGAGSALPGMAGTRWAGRLGSSADYRAYAKYIDRGSFVDLSGRDARDGWDQLRTGGRVDWSVTDWDMVALEGDLYRGGGGDRSAHLASLDPPFQVDTTNPVRFSGGHVLARWSRMAAGQPRTTLQVYFDESRRQDRVFTGVSTFDIDLQTRFAAGRRQDVLVGVGSRITSSRFENTFGLSIGDGRRQTIPLYTAFVQDEIKLAERLRLTLGARLEHHENTGFEFQPAARILWTPKEHQTLWAAVSRAVRTPSRVMNDSRFNSMAFPTDTGLPALVSIFGNPELKSERVTAIEVGYRVEPRSSLFVDVTAFYNRYRDLQSIEPGAPYFEAVPSPHLVIPQVLQNGLHGESLGLEAAAEWRVARRWKLSGSYARYRLTLHRNPGSQDLEQAEGTSPRNMLHLGSSVDSGSRVELDTNVYFVSALAGVEVPSYTRLDVRLGLRVASAVDLSLGLKNALDGRHVEWNGIVDNVDTTQVGRSAYASLQWRF